MKIWVINHHAAGPGRHSNICRLLALKGHDVVLFASSFQHNQYKDSKKYDKGESIRIEIEDGYKRVWVKTPPYQGNGIRRIINQLSFTWSTILSGRRMNRPDIVIGSSVHLFAAWAGYRLAKKHKVPFIFEVRDLWPQTLVDIGALKDKSVVTVLFRKLENFLYNKADKIISVLPSAVDYISALGIPKDKVIYIPNGINIEWFDNCVQSGEKHQDLEEFFALNEDKHIFTYTGAHGIANGLQTVIDAAYMLQQQGEESIKILLVGEGPQKELLYRQCRVLGLNNIVFYPAVPKDFVPFILVNSTVTLATVKRSPVHMYGLSMNKLFDYMASQKPMIFAASTSFDFAREAKCGISIEPDNPAQLAEAIVKLKNTDREKREKMGRNGRVFVEKHHEFTVLVDRLERELKDVAARGKTQTIYAPGGKMV